MHEDTPVASHRPDSAEPGVGRMFDRIAPTYDLLNHVLSFGRDFAWRHRTARRLAAGRTGRIIDLATGTGDLLISLLQQHPAITDAVGLDLSANMLAVCGRKLRKRDLLSRVRLIRGDACATSFSDNTFDAATMAFGIRNTPDASRTLREIHRILKPGGTALILEFSLPQNRVVRKCYLTYLRVMVPLIGTLVSRDKGAYRYLNESIEAFHTPEKFVAQMREVGFSAVSATSLTLDVASIYQGLKQSHQKPGDDF